MVFRVSICRFIYFGFRPCPAVLRDYSWKHHLSTQGTRGSKWGSELRSYPCPRSQWTWDSDSQAFVPKAWGVPWSEQGLPCSPLPGRDAPSQCPLLPSWVSLSQRPQRTRAHWLVVIGHLTWVLNSIINSSGTAENAGTPGSAFSELTAQGRAGEADSRDPKVVRGGMGKAQRIMKTQRRNLVKPTGSGKEGLLEE